MIRKMSKELPVGGGKAAFELPACRYCPTKGCRNPIYIRDHHLESGQVRCTRCGAIYNIVFKAALGPTDEVPDPDLAEPNKPWFWAEREAAT